MSTPDLVAVSFDRGRIAEAHINASRAVERHIELTAALERNLSTEPAHLAESLASVRSWYVSLIDVWISRELGREVTHAR
ncbi:hypothetical protein ACFQ07_24730 [Actinomadura adrarensis]|uniref:Uncharacterized protein n=1 Tax=Actinomadura adrarensis TaxID=1819600 RepID=A0ABW3CLQ0_9ACTN